MRYLADKPGLLASQELVKTTWQFVAQFEAEKGVAERPYPVMDRPPIIAGVRFGYDLGKESGGRHRLHRLRPKIIKRLKLCLQPAGRVGRVKPALKAAEIVDQPPLLPP